MSCISAAHKVLRIVRDNDDHMIRFECMEYHKASEYKAVHMGKGIHNARMSNYMANCKDCRVSST